MTILGFVLTLAVQPWLIGGFVTLRWLVLLFAVPLMVACGPHWPRLGWAWGVPLVWGALTILWAPDVPLAVNRWLELVILWLAWSLGRSDELAKGMCWGLAVNAVICLIQLVGWWPAPVVNSPSGLYLNRNMMAEIAAPLAVWAGLSRQWKAGVGPVLCLILAPDRAAVVAVGIGLWAWRRWRWAIAALMLAAFAGLMWWKGLADLHARGDIWWAAVSELKPWGVGMGAFQVNHRYYEYVHCDALEFAYELGIGSLSLGWIIWRGFRGNGPVAAKFTLAAILAESLFSFPLELPSTAVLGASLLGSLCDSRGSLRVPEPRSGKRDMGHPHRKVRKLAKSSLAGVRRLEI